MNKLFRAGLYRLRKNKGAYACVIIPPIYSDNLSESLSQ